jgi:hypothetical protein
MYLNTQDIVAEGSRINKNGLNSGRMGYRARNKAK